MLWKRSGYFYLFIVIQFLSQAQNEYGKLVIIFLLRELYIKVGCFHSCTPSSNRHLGRSQQVRAEIKNMATFRASGRPVRRFCQITFQTDCLRSLKQKFKCESPISVHWSCIVIVIDNNNSSSLTSHLYATRLSTRK